MDSPSSPTSPLPKNDSSSGMPVFFHTIKPAAPKLAPALSSKPAPPSFKFPVKPAPAAVTEPPVTPLIPHTPTVQKPELAPPVFKVNPPPLKQSARPPQLLNPDLPGLLSKNVKTPPPYVETTPPDVEEESQASMLEVFREELQSYLPSMIEALELLALDIENEEPWKTLKTRFHTIKGAANTVGLNDWGNRAARAEDAAFLAVTKVHERHAAQRQRLIEALIFLTDKAGLPCPVFSDIIPPVQFSDLHTEMEQTSIQEDEKSPSIAEASSALSKLCGQLETWQREPSLERRESFLQCCASLEELCRPIQAPLSASIHDLQQFTAKVPAHPPEVFFSIISRALNDARLFVEALGSDPQLTWSRKWGFYFSSLEIALAASSRNPSDPSSSHQNMDSKIDPEMVGAFVEEALQSYESIEQTLVRWERGEEPVERQAECRRHFHTLKGAANSVGLHALGSQFHLLEDRMSHSTSNQQVTALLQCLDQARQYTRQLSSQPHAAWKGDWASLLDGIPSPSVDLKAATSNEPAIDPEMASTFIEEAEALLDPIEAAILAWEVDQEADRQQATLKRHFHTLKGAANSVGLAALGSDFHALEDFMGSLLTSESTTPPIAFLLSCLDDLRGFLTTAQTKSIYAWEPVWDRRIQDLRHGNSTSKATQNSLSPDVSIPALERQTLRVEASQLQELMHLIAELIAEQSRMGEHLHLIQQLRQKLQSISGQIPDTALRSELDDLGYTLHSLRERLENDDQSFRRVAKRIQSDLIDLNMGPVGSLFHRLSRSFRDACREENKEARWIVEGADVQLDRAVVDQLYGPMLHVVRNAVAHGIESPEQRSAAGKDPCGTVTIRAQSRSDHAVIEVSDDGPGINEDVIRRKAIERGLLEPSVTSINSEQAVALLFSPGFSTKETVTNVAGRGVGLDVVKGDIEGLNGSVGVSYRSGAGTTWHIRVPLTLSATEALIIQAGSVRAALPLAMVDRCHRLESSSLNERKLISNFNADEEPLTLLDLGLFLNTATAEPPTHAVIIDSGIERAALAVNGFVNRREIVLKDLGPLFSSVGLYSGVTAESDGSLIPVIQIPFLLDWIHHRDSLPGQAEKTSQASAPCEPAAPPPTARIPHILLADDSPSVRKVQEKELRKLGYEVVLAQDGQEALDYLNHHHVDLLITDWEMPRLDGCGLIRAVRLHPSLGDLLILVISSRVNDDFIKEAMSLGANACLAKPFQATAFKALLQTLPLPFLNLTGLDPSHPNEA
ncbi:MAG: Hpt domain-containing protein [Candidatus Methylacidiphilales bacterium]